MALENENTAKNLEIGKVYDVVFATGKYEVEYENSVRCIKLTPQSYRVKRPDGTTRLVGKGMILRLKEIQLGASNEKRFD